MRRFAKNDNQAICNYCGQWKPTDLTNQQLEEMDWKCDECKAKEGTPEVQPTETERGSKEVSKYDPEYEFLVKLVKILVKEGVPPQEIKSIADAYPFETVDDVGDLTAKLWTLATTKYQIPREWLIKKLPKNASLKKEAADEGFWIDPSGKVIKIRDSNTDYQTHNDWIQNNKKMLTDQYGIDFSQFDRLATKYQNNILIENGWVRIGDSSNGAIGMRVKDLRRIPRAAEDALFSFYSGGRVDIEDLNGKLVEIGKLEGDLQKAVNEQLRMSVAASKMLSKADLWPAQKDADDMINHAPGYLAYSYGQDKEADGEFTGAEFSTNDVGVNPTLDSGPFSSPEDHGAKPQKSPFPNTNWLPADDQNLDEQPYSNIASSFRRPFSKTAGLDGRYWIAPDGTEFNAGTHHGAWVGQHADVLKQYGIKKTQNMSDAYAQMFASGWSRVSNERGFTIQVADLRRLPAYLDDFIAKHYAQGDVIRIGTDNEMVEISDPFPKLQRQVNKALQQTQASLKEADLSGQIVNQIVNALHANGGVTWNLSQGNMVGTPNYAVSIYPDRAQILDGVDFDRVEEFIISNSDLLDNPENSFGAWSHDGKVYLDVVATIPDINKAVELGKQHNQIAIWDLKNGEQISTGGTGEQKHASQQSILPQQLQDEVAAKTSPVYNIALTNYAEAVKRGHEKDRALEYAIKSTSNLEQIDPKKLVELINEYL